LNHIAFQALLDYVDNSGPKDVRTHIEAHLPLCEECRLRLEEARRVAQADTSSTMTPPAELLHRVLAAFRRRQQRIGQPLAILATLQFDSATQFAGLGARGAVAERHLLYSFKQFDLDLQISRDQPTKSLMLRGQLLPGQSSALDLEGAVVHLSKPGTGERLRLTDAVGQFSISGLTTGSYHLQVDLADRQLVVENLEILQ
jgi:hypothetical protein